MTKSVTWKKEKGFPTLKYVWRKKKQGGDSAEFVPCTNRLALSSSLKKQNPKNMEGTSFSIELV
jgi:hypothetical protein